MGLDRRSFLTSFAAATAGLALAPDVLRSEPRLRVTGMELLPVRATARTVWLFVRLRTDTGLTGLGEASDAFGFANTTKLGTRMDRAAHVLKLIEASRRGIAAYRQQGDAAVKGGFSRHGVSAITSALGRPPRRDVPVHALFAEARDSCQRTPT